LIGFVALLIGAFDALLEAPMYSRLRLPEIADGTMPEHTAASGRRWTTAFILSAFIPALTYYPAFALGGTFVKPSAFLPQGIQPDPGLGDHQRPDYAGPDAVRAQARQPVRHRPAVGRDRRRVGCDRLCRAMACRPRLQDRLPVLDRRLEADERETVFDLPDLSRTVHGVFRDRAARPASQFLDHGGTPGSALFDQYPGADAGLHRARGRAIRHPLAHRKAVQPTARPRLRAAVDHRRHPVRAATGDLRRDRDLHLAADRLQPAGRPDL